MILLYPDYMAADYKHETYMEWTQAATAKFAVKKVRRMAQEVCGDALDRPEDMILIAVLEGHHMDRSDGEGKVV